MSIKTETGSKLAHFQCHELSGPMCTSFSRTRGPLEATFAFGQSGARDSRAGLTPRDFRQPRPPQTRSTAPKPAKALVKVTQHLGRRRSNILGACHPMLLSVWFCFLFLKSATGHVSLGSVSYCVTLICQLYGWYISLVVTM